MGTIATLTTIKRYIELDAAQGDDDTLLEEIHDSAVALFERMVGWHLDGQETQNRVLDGSGTHTMYLPQPVSDGGTATAVAERLSLTEDWTTLDASNYEVDGRRITRTDGCVFTAGEFNVRVTVAVGYDAEAGTPIDPPPLVRQAVLDLISVMYRNRATVNPRSVVAFEGEDPAGLPFRLPSSVFQAIRSLRAERGYF